MAHHQFIVFFGIVYGVLFVVSSAGLCLILSIFTFKTNTLVARNQFPYTKYLYKPWFSINIKIFINDPGRRILTNVIQK